MISGIIYAVGLLTVSILIAWWFLLRKKPTPAPSSGRTSVDRVKEPFPRVSPRVMNQYIPKAPGEYSRSTAMREPVMPLREYSRSMGMSEPTQNTHIEHISDPEVIDEQKLLEISKNAPPHPEPLFTSRLRSLGNPLVGDLVIPPRRAGVSLPYNASPDDIRPGYFTAQ